MVPSPAHVAQGIQARGAMKSWQKEQRVVLRFPHQYKVGTPCYALHHGPRRDKDPRWVPAIVTKIHGSRGVYVRVCPRGPVWRRHIEQLRPRYGIEEDLDPGQASESMLLENLGSSETPKEQGDPQMEEPKSGADLENEIHQSNTGGYISRNQTQGYQWTVSMDLATLEDSNDLREH